MDQYAVIVAGGRGVRMQSDLPKQFIPIAGQPLLMHTIRAFYAYRSDLPLIVVLPDQEHQRWSEICKQYSFHIPHTLISGGTSRPYSVRKGIMHISSPESIVAIHDGVRPLVSPDLIRRSFEEAEQYGSAVASVPLKDSIREMTGSSSLSRDRHRYRLVQTPQTFHTTLIRQAYQAVDSIENFSDEASLLEAGGGNVRLIEGDYRNIKVTTPEDLKIAEAFLSEKASG